MRCPGPIWTRCSARCSRAGAVYVRPGDIFLTIGAFWGVSGMGMLLQELKNSGVIVGAFIHDIIPITDPEYFEVRDVKMFAKGVVEALTFADFILTTSAYNKASLIAHGRAQAETLPVHLVAGARAVRDRQPGRHFRRRREHRDSLRALRRYDRGAQEPDLSIQHLEAYGASRPRGHPDPGLRGPAGLARPRFHGAA